MSNEGVLLMPNTTTQADGSVFGTIVHMAGTGYQTATAGATLAIGVTEIAIDTGSLSLSKGQTGKFTGSAQVYTIASIDAATSRDVNDQGVGIHGVVVTQITVTPALVATLADNVAFTPTVAAQALPPYQLTDSVVILADADNGANIFVGSSTVTTSFGFMLAAGSAIEVKCTNPSSIYIIGSANDHVYLTGS
jgi:hypothetical protein